MGRKAAPPFSAVGQYLSDKATVFKKVSLSLPFFKKYFGMGDQSEGFFSLEKVRGYYLENTNLSKVFVVEGEAVNHWKESRSFIKVKGVLLDSKGNKVREQEVYCGNSLSSQFGISFSNVNILPNKNVPFMIVFPDLTPEGPQTKSVQGPGGKPGEVPSSLSDFTVEVTSSQKGSK
jgi:heme-degrading monooxygenase HmoA